MSEAQTIGLTKDQRDILLQGLRFVRSSVLLELRDPDPGRDAADDRHGRLERIESLVNQLGGPRAARD